MQIHLLHKKIPHHAAHSGYDQLVKYVPGKPLSASVRQRLQRFVDRIPEKLLKRWTWVGGWYNRESFAKELQVALQLPFCRGIYHYLYGEDDFHWGGMLPFRSGSRIVVSYHQPPALFSEVIKDTAFITTADALVVCGTNQVAPLQRITGRDNVFFVPHGVDTDFFTPPPEPGRAGSSFTTVSVGWWLRDVEMMKQVMERALVEAPDVTFNVVTFPEYFPFYEGLPNVKLLTGISDDELLAKYREADALLLPMKDCTANNAILEAMACGVPVLSTAVGGIGDYVDDGCGILVPPGDSAALFDALMKLKREPETRASMGARAREKALQFDWRAVGSQMTAVYERIWSMPPAGKETAR